MVGSGAELVSVDLVGERREHGVADDGVVLGLLEAPVQVRRGRVERERRVEHLAVFVDDEEQPLPARQDAERHDLDVTADEAPETVSRKLSATWPFQIFSCASVITRMWSRN